MTKLSESLQNIYQFPNECITQYSNRLIIKANEVMKKCNIEIILTKNIKFDKLIQSLLIQHFLRGSKSYFWSHFNPCETFTDTVKYAISVEQEISNQKSSSSSIQIKIHNSENKSSTSIASYKAVNNSKYKNSELDNYEINKKSEPINEPIENFEKIHKPIEQSKTCSKSQSFSSNNDVSSNSQTNKVSDKNRSFRV